MPLASLLPASDGDVRRRGTYAQAACPGALHAGYRHEFGLFTRFAGDRLHFLTQVAADDAEFSAYFILANLKLTDLLCTFHFALSTW